MGMLIRMSDARKKGPEITKAMELGSINLASLCLIRDGGNPWIVISGPFFLASDIRISIPITAAVIILNLPGRGQFHQSGLTLPN
jgi:hypothetical protein